jgi:hypothetical protein
MSTLTMPRARRTNLDVSKDVAKETPTTPAPAEESGAKKETSLKVSVEDGRLIVRLATMRGMSIANLFREPDVQEFFSHLLIVEMARETERLEARKKT